MTSKVLLLYLPGLDIDTHPVIALGLGYLVAAVKQDRPVKAVFYQLVEYAYKQLPDIMTRFQPDIIGFTSTTFNRGNVRRVSKWVRGNYPNVKIVIGGVHASFLIDHVFKNYEVDYIVIGEGEATFKELCMALDEDRPLRDVKGIAYREGETVVCTEQREVVHNLDDILTPDLSYVSEIMKRSGLGFILSSRGCPVRCYFCSTASYWGQKVRMSSPVRVVNEIENQVQNYGVSKIWFYDDAFNFSMKRVLEICDEILARKLNIKWAVSCRVHPASQEMVDRMVEAGCRHIYWGIESGSVAMLERINKKITLEQIKKAFEFCRKHMPTLGVGTYTMIGNPGECEETINETVALINTLPITDSPTPAFLYILPGTPIYNEMKEKNPDIDKFWVETDASMHPSGFDGNVLGSWMARLMQSGEKISCDMSQHFFDKIQYGDIPEMKMPKFEIEGEIV